MSNGETPERANARARPERGETSDLVEIAKRNGDFSRHYGRWLGALLYWLSLKAARPRSFWWTGSIAAGIAVAGGWLQSHGWLIFPLGK